MQLPAGALPYFTARPGDGEDVNGSKAAPCQPVAPTQAPRHPSLHWAVIFDLTMMTLQVGETLADLALVWLAH